MQKRKIKLLAVLRIKASINASAALSYGAVL
jgi:hypothetical protein